MKPILLLAVFLPLLGGCSGMLKKEAMKPYDQALEKGQISSLDHQQKEEEFDRYFRQGVEGE